MADQSGDIVCHQLVSERAVYVGSAPVSLQIGGYDSPTFRERLQDLAEHLGRASTSVQQNEWLPRPVDFVVHLQPIHLSVAFGGAHQVFKDN